MDVKVKTVTYGRKKTIGRYSNAEYILTAEVQPEQTPEEVMEVLRKIVKNQLDEVINEEQEEFA